MGTKSEAYFSRFYFFPALISSTVIAERIAIFFLAAADIVRLGFLTDLCPLHRFTLRLFGFAQAPCLAVRHGSGCSHLRKASLICSSQRGKLSGQSGVVREICKTFR